MKVKVADLLRFLEWAEAQKVWDSLYIDETEADYDESALKNQPPTDKFELEGVLCPQRIDAEEGVVVFDGIPVAIKHGGCTTVASLYKKWAKKQTAGISVVVTLGSAADLPELEAWANAKGWKVAK